MKIVDLYNATEYLNLGTKTQKKKMGMSQHTMHSSALKKLNQKRRNKKMSSREREDVMAKKANLVRKLAGPRKRVSTADKMAKKKKMETAKRKAKAQKRRKFLSKLKGRKKTAQVKRNGKSRTSKRKDERTLKGR